MNGPVLIREHVLATPGPHTEAPKVRRWLTLLRTVLLILGLGGVGYYGYELANQHIYQVYENWAFDQQIGGRPAVTFADYIRERTPFGFLEPSPRKSPVVPPLPASSVQPVIRPASGSLLGRIEIGRLNLSAIVREGVDSGTLSRAVGHVPSTSLPGQSGNFAIAAHRDTLFRALKDIHDGDLVEFQSPAGTYKYQVYSTKIVKPSDVSVLQPNGGDALLTMITCYPFYYVGSAPKRFIVQARMLSNEAVSKKPAEVSNNTPLRKARANKHRTIRRATLAGPRFERSGQDKAKKHGLWHKLFHWS